MLNGKKLLGETISFSSGVESPARHVVAKIPIIDRSSLYYVCI